MAQLAARRIPDPKVGGSTPSSFIIIFDSVSQLFTLENVPVTSVIPNNKPTVFHLFERKKLLSFV